MCVFSSHLFLTSSSSLDVLAGVTQEEGHTGLFLIHLPSAVHALIFLARRIQHLSLVDGEVEFCVLSILIVLHLLRIFIFIFLFYSGPVAPVAQRYLITL